MKEDLRYMQVGGRICIWCYNNRGVIESVYLRMEDTKALRREVRGCDLCGLLAIGEKIPPSLEIFFNNNMEEGDTPLEEQIGS